MKNQIICPYCRAIFDLPEALHGELYALSQKEFERKMNEQTEKFMEEKRKLETELAQLAGEREQQAQLLKAELAKALTLERQKIESQTLETYEERFKSMQEENEKRKAENKILREKEVSLMRKESELNERQEVLGLEIEKQLLEKQREIEENARAKERERFELEKTALLKQIDDNKKLAEEMKRKAEQGSMQLQGEVQEMALLDLLTLAYPYDSITEVPKGVRGADSIQTVMNTLQQACGSIVYESKRTKVFANEWIDKLKQDQISCKADFAVLVTETMPANMERFGERNGVWICSLKELRSISFILREMLLRTHSVKVSQENRGEKMELLYAYLTSAEFVQTIKRIVENYDNMNEQLATEKKAIMKIWSHREKQIWTVQENLAALFGSIKGIAGKELPASEVLELPEHP